MDPAMQPINGISLERYADLGAAIADFMNDPAKVAEIVAKEGVNPADFEAAKVGWTARMQDMSLMGRVAMAYMPLYQAALARRKGGQAQASYEDFVGASAAIKVWGPQVGLDACGVSMSDWSEVAGHWTQTMAQNMGQYAGHHGYLSQEEARLRAGGQPRRVNVVRAQGQMPQAVNANPMAAAMGVPASVYVPPGATPVQAAMQNQVMQQAAQNQAAINADPFGHAFGQVAAFVTGGVVAGSNVMVRWPNGQEYGGRVMQTAPQQTLVQFSNGAQEWVPANAVRVV